MKKESNMQRVIHGDYQDPNSTRDIVEMTEQEWNLMKDNIEIYYLNNVSILDFPDEVLRQLPGMSEKLAEYTSAINPDAKQEAQLAKEVIESGILEPVRDDIRRRIKLMDGLKKRFHMNIGPLGAKYMMRDITPEEYGGLIDALQSVLQVCFAAVNMPLGEIEKIGKTTDVDGSSIGTILFSEIKDSSTKGEERHQLKIAICQDRMEILYCWLEKLNQPYEGAIYEG